jgi:hypothetical protein
MDESPPDKRTQEATPRPKSNARWGIAFAIGWSLLLFLILPFSVFPIEIRLTVTIASLVAFYVLSRSLRGWHYLWMIPLILFWLFVNYGIWTSRYWSEEDYKKAFEERLERIEKEQRDQR